ncbi:MAG TPA: Hsp70 family protein, partial [Ignavibacteriaceae bacterium]|nr:Hsp70 family protein [Ignavibacteriaceae bacterium]
SGLDKNEIEKMKNSAKEHAAEDKMKKEAVETKNQADSLVFQTKKQIEELKDKMPADIKSRLETEIKKVEDAMATNNTEQIKSATESLNKTWNEVASQLYSQTGQQQQQAHQQGQQQTGTAEDSKGDVQDASYEVVDDDKK